MHCSFELLTHSTRPPPSPICCEYLYTQPTSKYLITPFLHLPISTNCRNPRNLRGSLFTSLSLEVQVSSNLESLPKGVGSTNRSTSHLVRLRHLKVSPTVASKFPTSITPFSTVCLWLLFMVITQHSTSSSCCHDSCLSSQVVLQIVSRSDGHVPIVSGVQGLRWPDVPFQSHRYRHQQGRSPLICAPHNTNNFSPNTVDQPTSNHRLHVSMTFLHVSR